MNFTQKFSIVFLLFIYPFFLYAQYEEIEYGEIPKEDLEMTVYKADSSADAVILAKVSTMEINQGVDFSVTHKNYARIKLLKPSSSEWANFSFDYQHYDGYESMSRVKAMITYPNGKQYKLKRSDIIKSRDDGWTNIQFSFPELEVGCIIEYSYIIRVNDIYPMEDFVFQYSIPVRYAAFTYRIDRDIQTNFQITQEKYVKAMENGFEMRNVPALKLKDYTDNLANYTGKIKTIIEAQRDVYSGNNVILNLSWQKQLEQLYSNEYFGEQLSDRDNYDRILLLAKDVINADIPLRQKLEQFQDFLFKRVEWDGSYGVLCNYNLNEAFERGKANATELNLMMSVLLKEIGIVNLPCLVKLMENGWPEKEDRSLDDFDYALLMAEIEDELVFIDVSSPVGLPWHIRPEALNREGLLASLQEPTWVKLKSPLSELAFFSDFEVQGRTVKARIQANFSGYSAEFERKLLKEGNAKSYWQRVFQSIYPRAYIENMETKNAENLNEKLQHEFTLEINDAFEVIKDSIFVTPFYLSEFSYASFLDSNRLYPMNINYPIHETSYLKIDFPENYKIASIPKSLKLINQDGTAEYQFITEGSNSSLTVNQKLNLNKQVYSELEYLELQEIFRNVNAKNLEKIILVKTPSME